MDLIQGAILFFGMFAIVFVIAYVRKKKSKDKKDDQ